MTIRVGTRGSALALAQARATADALHRASGEPCELVVVRTEGDTSAEPLAVIGGTGVFAGALRTALRAGRCDVVVHSLKDLPVEPEPGLTIVAVPMREDARDALCARDGVTLAALPTGATVGTGSPRRRAQIVATRPDVTVVDVRGNVDTRLRLVRDGDLHAVVLAAAGLGRIGRIGEATDLLPLDTWPTAAGQGALAVEVRDEDAVHLREPGVVPTGIGAAAAAITDAASWSAAAAERTVLRRLQAGCAAPIGVASRVARDSAELWASVHRPGGGFRIDRRRTATFPAGDVAARDAALQREAGALADDLLAAGAADLAPLGATA
ncbi:hydroxymethylbilane synthase [uncultured Amnibacterium sp.]|uniref:hydroxymethylbilane synthase n=1 Tax=uncultured Amnibacterium sp. TaxID=1631851 RepID=UPI0035CAE253